MSRSEIRRTDVGTSRPEFALQAMLILIVICVICVIWLVSTQNINWDEFYFLAHIHSYVNELPLSSLQTFYVHLFKFIAYLPVDEIGQITAGRFLMAVLYCATSYFIYRISLEFVEKTPACMGTLAYLTSGYAIGHGASFRADPIAAFAVMFSLYILFTRRRSVLSLLSVSILTAVAILVTMKSVLFSPAYLAAFVWRYGEKRVVRDATIVVALAVLFYVVLFAVHKLNIIDNQLSTVGKASRMLDKTILHDAGLFPRLPYIGMWGILSIGMLLLALVATLSTRKKQLFVVILMIGPVLSIVVYRNAFPYFFPFITPTLGIAAAIGAGWLCAYPRFLYSLAAVMLLCFGIQFGHFSKQNQDAQQQLILAVKYIFPDPVKYIDRNSMISTYPKVGFFMSSWGVEGYRERARPVFSSLIHQHEPPLVIANGPALVAALYDIQAFNECCGLLPDDVRTLKENYLPYWGWLWVAGKASELDAGQNMLSFIIGGGYRLEATYPVSIDGVNVVPGASVNLAVGQVSVVSDKPQLINLIWDVPERPSVEPDSTPIYAGFRSL